MMRALFTAATGMKSQQLHTDVIANNLANVNTTGFKKARPNFQDLLYQKLKEAGSPVAIGTEHPTGLYVGLGVRPIATEKIYTQGTFEETSNQLDIAVNGEGFFQILLPDNSIGYTRDGTFKLDSQGQIVTASGYLLQPNINIPPDALWVDISPEGQVSVKMPNQIDLQPVGNIEVVRFINSGGLEAIGRNLVKETVASGPPQVGQPGINGFGSLEQGFLEMSNVAIVDEMVKLIISQRAFEINSKAIQTSDDMLGIANNLRR